MRIHFIAKAVLSLSLILAIIYLLVAVFAYAIINSL